MGKWKEGVIGSVFSIEELIGGFYLKHVGRVVEFERNRKFVWLGRFAVFPFIWIGTDFTFGEVGSGTKVTETLYFQMAPWWLLLFPVLGLRPCFTPRARRNHRGLFGPNINRQTVANVEAAGLDVVSVESKGPKMLKKIVARSPNDRGQTG